MARNHPSLSEIHSGTYVPTITTLNNIGGTPSNYSCQYIRVGDVVTVSGQVGITTTTTDYGLFAISLPIASDLIQHSYCSGVGLSSQGACRIRSETALNAAEFFVNNGVTSIQYIMFTFTYRIN